MSKSAQKLDALADLLSRTGGDAKRIEAVRRTQKFRRSWLEVAEILHEIRKEKRYTDWGYDDFYGYCSQELTLKRPTVDKLMISFSTLQKRAPKLLEHDGVAERIPNFDAVDYFSRAVERHQSQGPSKSNSPGGKANAAGDPGAEMPEGPSAQWEDDLRKAVFEENLPLRDIKKQFNPICFPSNSQPSPRAQAQKVLVGTRRLLDNLEASPAVTNETKKALQKVLSDLQDEVQSWIEEKTRDKKAATKAAAKSTTQSGSAKTSAPKAQADREAQENKKSPRKRDKVAATEPA